MKKICLLCVVAFSFLASDAQVKKSKSKKSTVNKEARAKAEMAKKEKERYDNAETARLDRLYADSIRLDNERIADSSFDAERVAWKAGRIHEIDSTNTEKWKGQMAQQEEWLKVQRSRDEIIKAAKLDYNQGRQVKYINQTYHNKARLVREDSTLTDEQKKAQYITLNNERRDKIRVVIGKSKEKKLEKERQSYVKTHQGVDLDEAWIDSVASLK